MPTAKQRTVDINITQGSLGPINGLSTSDSTRLKEMFPASPIHKGNITPTERKNAYMNLSLSAVVEDDSHTFTRVSTDYSQAPDISKVDIEKLNLPSPYVPNPTSPGPGSQNAADKPPPPEGFGIKPNATYGSGEGSSLNPKTSSERISRQTLGNYLLGKSTSTPASNTQG